MTKHDRATTGYYEYRTDLRCEVTPITCCGVHQIQSTLNTNSGLTGVIKSLYNLDYASSKCIIHYPLYFPLPFGFFFPS